MSREELIEILTYNIPLEGLTINSGIYIFYKDNTLEMGISYEELDGNDVYIFNLFCNNEYIQIDGEYNSIFDDNAITNILKTFEIFS